MAAVKQFHLSSTLATVAFSHFTLISSSLYDITTSRMCVCTYVGVRVLFSQLLLHSAAPGVQQCKAAGLIQHVLQRDTRYVHATHVVARGGRVRPHSSAGPRVNAQSPRSCVLLLNAVLTEVSHS